MEKEKTERLKEFLLAGFVLVSVVLILTLWTNTLLDRGLDGPGFYRETIQGNEAFYLTRAAEASSGTSLPTKEHKNEQKTPTPTPTAIPITATSNLFTPTLESDQ